VWFLAEIAGSSLEYANSTTMHPLALVMVLACGLGLVFSKRRAVILPCLIMAATVTPTQRFVIASVDFSLLRIIVLFALARFMMRAEYKSIRWNALDFALIVWAASGTVIYTLQWGEFGALVTRLGVVFETLGLYFFFRATIRSWDDIAGLAPYIAVTAGLLAVMFAFEWATRRNVFSIFGGVPEHTLVRNGRVRCQGAFSHAIIAGCFFASLMPIAAAGYWSGPSKRRAAVASVFFCLVIVFFTSSSTPLASVMAVFAGLGLWWFRKHMGALQVAAVFGLMALHLVMNTPVWHLVSRIDLVGGSTGYHRYKLVDSAIEHFGEWAVLGTKTTANWGYGMQDITVQYVLEGVRGGALTLGLFLLVLALAFRNIGNAVRALPDKDPRSKIAWAVGVSLGVHAVTFFGVSYFGQVTMIWCLSLALSASVAGATAATTRERAAMAQRRRPARPPRRGPAPAPAV